MASQTTNLNLKKPALDDDALIADINGNMDTLDSTIGAPSSASAVDGANAFAKINSLNSKKLENSVANHAISLIGDTNFVGFDIRPTGTSNFFRLNFFDNGKVTISRYANGAWQTEVTLRNAD